MAIELEVKLKDGVSAPAGSAAHQVDVLTRQMQSLQTQMIKANALNDEKSFNRAAASYQKMGEQVRALGGNQNKTADAMKKSATVTRDSSGASGDLTQSLLGLNASTVTAAGAATAAIAVYAALGAGFLKVSQHAYDAAAAHGVLLARLNAMGGGGSIGEKTVEMIRQLQKVLPQTTKELTPMAEEMMRAGVRSLPHLEQGLKAAAAASALVEGGGKAMTGFVASLHQSAKAGTGIGDLTGKLDAMGLTIEEVGKAAGIASKHPRALKAHLDALGSTPRGLQQLGLVIQDLAIRKGAASLKAMGATWQSISGKMSEGITRLFEGVQKTEGFQKLAIELQRLAQMFGLIDNSSKGTKADVTSMFNAIFKIGAKAIEGVHILILELQIAYLQLRIAMNPVLKLFSDFMGKVEDKIPMVSIFVNAIKGVALAFTGLTIAIGALLAPFIASIALVTTVITGLLSLLGSLAPAFFNIGKGIVEGIANGIKSGYDALKSKIGALADLVTGTAKNKLEIKSPSRVFARIGTNVTRGFEQGINQGSPEVAGATAKMAMGAAGGGAVGVSAGAATGKGGVTVNLAPGSIQIAGAGSPHEALALVEESIVSLFERVALTQGVA